MGTSTKSSKKPKRQTRNVSATKRPSQSRARAGSGGLRAKQAFNWTRALPLIILLALAGGVMVYRSYAGSAEDVAAVYQEVLGRAPDTSGWYYWTDQVNQGKPLSEVRSALQNSAEYKQLQAAKAAQTTTTQTTTTQTPLTQAPAPDSSGNRENVRKAYQEALGRNPDPEGWTYWEGRMNGGMSYASLVAALRASAEGSKKSGTGGSGASNVQSDAVAEAKAKGLPTTTASGTPINGVGCLDKRLDLSGAGFILNRCKDQVKSMYNQLFGRNPTEAETYQWAHQELFLNNKTIEWVREQLKATDEHKKYEASLLEQGRKVAEVAKAENASLLLTATRICSVAMGYNCDESDAKSKNSWVSQILAHLESGKTVEEVYAIYAQSGYGGQLDIKDRRDSNAPSGKVVPNEWSKNAWQLFNELGGKRSDCPDEYDGYVNGTRQNFGHHGCLAAVGAYTGDLLRMYNSGEMSWADVANYVKNGPKGESIVCSQSLAAVIPTCGGGALGVSKESVDALVKAKQQEHAKAAEAAKKAKEQNKAKDANSNIQPSSLTGLSGNLATVTKPVDLALATTAAKKALPVPTSLQGLAGTQKVLAKTVEIESQIVNSIVFTDCFDGKVELSNGDAGPCVSYIQEALALLNGDEYLATDGFYNEETQRLVAEFQEKHNVTTSKPGVADYDTVVLLSRAVMPKKHNSPYSPGSGMLVNNR